MKTFRVMVVFMRVDLKKTPCIKKTNCDSDLGDRTRSSGMGIFKYSTALQGRVMKAMKYTFPNQCLV